MLGLNLAFLLLLVLLLTFDIVPAPIAAVICAALMLITGVLTLPQFYRGIDWNTCILIGAMIAPAVAMTKTGAAAVIGDYVVNTLGSFGPVCTENLIRRRFWLSQAKLPVAAAKTPCSAHGRRGVWLSPGDV